MKQQKYFSDELNQLLERVPLAEMTLAGLLICVANDCKEQGLDPEKLRIVLLNLSENMLFCLAKDEELPPLLRTLVD